MIRPPISCFISIPLGLSCFYLLTIQSYMQNRRNRRVIFGVERCAARFLHYSFSPRCLTCYWPDGTNTSSTGYPYYACSSIGDSSCCREDEVCLGNGLCYGATYGKEQLTREVRRESFRFHTKTQVPRIAALVQIRYGKRLTVHNCVSRLASPLGYGPTYSSAAMASAGGAAERYLRFAKKATTRPCSISKVQTS